MSENVMPENVTPENVMTDTNTYEALAIFKPVLDNEYADGVLRSFETLIKNNKGKIIKTEKLGRRRLAYDIAKYKDGFMVQFFLELPPETLVKVNRACKINEDVLRLNILSISAEQLELALSGKGGPPRREERPTGDGDRGGRGGFRPGGDRGGFRPGGDRRPPHAPRPPQQAPVAAGSAPAQAAE